MGTWPASMSSKVADKEAGYIPVRTPPPHMSTPPNETWFPWIVPLIFVVDVAAFVYTLYLNDCPSHYDDCYLVDLLGRFSFQSPKQNLYLGPSTPTLQKMGALTLNLVVDQGQVWRLITCMWLHVGVVHLLANMISLLFVGVRLEKEFGFWRIGLLYVLSGFGGSLASSIHFKYSHKEEASLTTSVGASGALFGLLGAMLSELIMNWTIYANKFAALLTLVVVIALNMAVGFLPNVDISSHIGGFIAGYFLGFVLLIRPQFGWVNRNKIPPGYHLKLKKPKHKCYQYIFWVMAFVILIIGYAAAAIVLFRPGRMQIIDAYFS